jgi:hypothetical protein
MSRSYKSSPPCASIGVLWDCFLGELVLSRSSCFFLSSSSFHLFPFLYHYLPLCFFLASLFSFLYFFLKHLSPFSLSHALSSIYDLLICASFFLVFSFVSLFPHVFLSFLLYRFSLSFIYYLPISVSFLFVWFCGEQCGGE